MKRNRLPENRLDIITPILSQGLRLYAYASAYPEFHELVKSGQAQAQGTRLYPITRKTPFAAKQAIEILGGYFRRELGFDFPPYKALEREHAHDRLFLVTREKDWGESEYAVGAIHFRWYDYSNAPAERVLSWVWLHPFLRRKGILSAYWELLTQLYGDFEVNPPLSAAMAAFLQKMRGVPIDPVLSDRE